MTGLLVHLAADFEALNVIVLPLTTAPSLMIGGPIDPILKTVEEVVV